MTGQGAAERLALQAAAIFSVLLSLHATAATATPPEPPKLSEEQLKGLSPEQIKELKWKMAHEHYHELHKGHEWMHMEMILILFGTLILAQIVLFLWRKHYLRSYQIVTTLGLWLIPLVFSLRHEWYRMLSFWTVFSVATIYVFFLASRRPLAPHIPRLVYKYFMVIYKVSSAVGVFGYGCCLADFLGVGLLLPNPKEHNLMGYGILFLFYGLYFGVLSRDIAEICAGRMASSIGYYSSTGIPAKQPNPKICAICGDELDHDEGVEKTCRLTCGHQFHEFCIRGWCMIGKKQTCPFCKEKVDLKSMFQSLWERADVRYGQLLDGLRYLVVWQPIILTLVQVIIWALGLQ